MPAEFYDLFVEPVSREEALVMANRCIFMARRMLSLPSMESQEEELEEGVEDLAGALMFMGKGNVETAYQLTLAAVPEVEAPEPRVLLSRFELIG